jgi:hypothetical protein
MSKWISVKQALPVEYDGVLALLFSDGEPFYFEAYLSEEGVWCCVGGDDLDGVTHWMPLPEEPGEEMTAINEQVGGNHYKDMAIQPIEYILKNGLGYCEGNVIKYISRYQFKNGVEDLKKAKHYIDLLIEAQDGGDNTT